MNGILQAILGKQGRVGGRTKESQPDLFKAAKGSRNTEMEERLAKVRDYFKVSEQFLKCKWRTAYAGDGLTSEAEAKATILDLQT